MTAEQQKLLSRLNAIGDRHGRPRGKSKIYITAGPNAFDAWASDGIRTIWHWIGTADQIACAVNNWMEQQHQKREFVSAEQRWAD